MKTEYQENCFVSHELVKQMLAHPSVQEKLKDLHAIFFEPTAGEGAFLAEILQQKLNYVNQAVSSRGSHWQYNILWALMSIYGIEYLPESLAFARSSMKEVFLQNYQDKTGRTLAETSDLYKSMQKVLELNIVQGNALARKNNENQWIVLQDWRKDVRKNFKRMVTRVPFYYDSLFKNPYRRQDDIDLFEYGFSADAPLKTYRTVNVMEIWKEEAIV